MRRLNRWRFVSAGEIDRDDVHGMPGNVLHCGMNACRRRMFLDGSRSIARQTPFTAQILVARFDSVCIRSALEVGKSFVSVCVPSAFELGTPDSVWVRSALALGSPDSVCVPSALAPGSLGSVCVLSALPAPPLTPNDLNSDGCSFGIHDVKKRRAIIPDRAMGARRVDEILEFAEQSVPRQRGCRRTARQQPIGRYCAFTST